MNMLDHHSDSKPVQVVYSQILHNYWQSTESHTHTHTYTHFPAQPLLCLQCSFQASVASYECVCLCNVIGAFKKVIIICAKGWLKFHNTCFLQLSQSENTNLNIRLLLPTSWIYHNLLIKVRHSLFGFSLSSLSVSFVFLSCKKNNLSNFFFYFWQNDRCVNQKMDYYVMLVIWLWIQSNKS